MRRPGNVANYLFGMKGDKAGWFGILGAEEHQVFVTMEEAGRAHKHVGRWTAYLIIQRTTLPVTNVPALTI